MAIYENNYVADPILQTEDMKKMFVGDIATESTDEELKTFIENICGAIVTDHIIIRKDNPKKTHFGFFTFESSLILDEVLLKRKELVFHGKNLEVKRAVPKNIYTTPGVHEKTKKLFIANLPKGDCSEEDLKHYFDVRHPTKYGIVESVQVIKKKDEEGNKMEENKGFGFVTVSSEDMADKMAIQHASFDFGGRKIELKKSLPPGGDRGRGRGRGSRGRGGRGFSRGGGGGRGASRGGSQGKQSYGGSGYGGGYAQDSWGGYSYGADYGDYSSYGGYGAGGYGYAAPPRGKGAARGGQQRRYNPY